MPQGAPTGGMNLPRFFVPPAMLDGETAVLDGENAAHAKVLRLTGGEAVTLCDGLGREARCTVVRLTPGQVLLRVEAVGPAVAEPRIFVTLYLGLPKADKLEHVIQKATELGAGAVVAFPSARSVSRPDEKALTKKCERWQKIAAAAAEQSGRGRIPQVSVLPSFAAAVAQAAQADWAALFYEKARHGSLAAALPPQFTTAALLTGPEGGLTEEEVALAAAAGLRICTLGKRILRCETAPLCALSALMFAAGELE